MLSKTLGRLALLAVIAAALSGCSTWENTMSGLGLYGPRDETTVPARPAAVAETAHTAPRSSDWCRQVATQSRQRAAENGFDAATQQRRYRESYRQCLFMDGTAARP